MDLGAECVERVRAMTGTAPFSSAMWSLAYPTGCYTTMADYGSKRGVYGLGDVGYDPL